MSHITSRDAVLELDSTPIGHLKGVTIRHNKTVIQDHDIGGGAPVILEPYEDTYEVEAEMGYVDGANYALLDTETPDVVLYPAGKTLGLPRYTAGSCVLSYELTVRAGTVIMERIRGPALTFVSDTVPS